MAREHGEEKIIWREKDKICFWSISTFISSKYILCDYFCYELDSHYNVKLHTVSESAQ